MKKLLFLLVFIAGVAVSGFAQQLRFYYYPSSNVYYDPAKKVYFYQNSGSWTSVRTLPTDIRVASTPRVTVYHNNPEVWRDNEVHIKKYKDTSPRGKAVGYKGSNPNKAKGKGKKS